MKPSGERASHVFSSITQSSQTLIVYWHYLDTFQHSFSQLHALPLPLSVSLCFFLRLVASSFFGKYCLPSGSKWNYFTWTEIRTSNYSTRGPLYLLLLNPLPDNCSHAHCQHYYALRVPTQQFVLVDFDADESVRNWIASNTLCCKAAEEYYSWNTKWQYSDNCVGCLSICRPVIFYIFKVFVLKQTKEWSSRDNG